MMMKKLVSPWSVSKSLSDPVFSDLVRVFCYSTKAFTSSKVLETLLYKRISPVGDPRVSIVPILEQWVDEGKPVHQNYLRTIVKQLRVYKRYRHALDVSTWMTEKRYMALSPADVAIRLDLISKVHGLTKAEEYFENISKQLKVYQTYGALLNCYAYAKAVERAESLMQQIRKLGFGETTLTYNAMLNLYSKMRQYGKLDTLVEEMTEKGISHDMYTCSIQLSTYVETSNIDKIDKLLQRMEADPFIFTDWTTYIIASKGYIEAGLMDKALAMLKKSEEVITGKRRREAYDSLLTSYACIGRKDELYRIWNLYKSSDRLYNSAYHCMIVSLLKLDDIVGAEQIFQEWEVVGTNYDFRLVNSLVSGYCKLGFLEKAETVINNAIEKGEKPWANTWEYLAAGFIKADRFAEGVEAMKKAILARPERKPNPATLAACLDHLKQKGDSEQIDEFASLLRLRHGGEPKSSNCTLHEMDGDVSDDKEDTVPVPVTRLESI